MLQIEPWDPLCYNFLMVYRMCLVSIYFLFIIQYIQDMVYCYNFTGNFFHGNLKLQAHIFRMYWNFYLK